MSLNILLLQDGKKLYKSRCNLFSWLTEEEAADYPLLLKKYWTLKKKEDAKKEARNRAKKEKNVTKQSDDIAEEVPASDGKIDPSVLAENKTGKRPYPRECTENKKQGTVDGPKRSKRLKENDERLTRFYCKQCDKSFRTEDIYTAHTLEHDQDGEVVNKNKEVISDEIFDVVFVGKKKDYKCRVCLQVYREKRDALAHQKVHDGTNPWYCEECDKHFLRKYKYSRHILMHTGTKNYECDACGKTFNGPDYLQRHKMTYCVDGRGRFKCDVCDEGFSEKRLLEAHISIHDGSNPFHCDVCDKYFLKRTPFENHMALHDDYKPYKCSTCDKRFVARGDFNRHVKSHDDDLYCCNTCQEVYTLHEDLEMHYQMSESCLEVICTECNVEFPCVSDLRNHLQSYAVSSSPEDPSAAVYICNFCQRGYHVHSSFLEHRPTHVSEKTKKCSHCDSTFNTRERLTTHVKLVHGVSTTYPCVQCGKVFNESVHLKRHTKTVHSKETIYRCLPCEKIFYMRTDLNRHVLTKQHIKTVKEEISLGGKFENLSKLRCAICEKVFQTLNELKRHEYLHQRVQVKPNDELVFNDSAADPVQSAYYRDTVYTIDGEQVILTDQQAELVNARLNIDTDGNYGIVYVNPSDAQDIKASTKTVSTASAKKEHNDGIDLTIEQGTVGTDQQNSVDKSTSIVINDATSGEEKILIHIPLSNTASSDASAATMVSGENNVAVSTDQCNEETFLAISEMVQQGRLDVSSLQVVQTDSNVSPTEETVQNICGV